MKLSTLIIVITLVNLTYSSKSKAKNTTIKKSEDEIKKFLREKDEEKMLGATKDQVATPVKITNVEIDKIKPFIPKKKNPPKMIPNLLVETWAKDISATLITFMEKRVVRPKVLLKGFSGVKTVRRNGTAIVEQMAAALEELLNRRAEAAEQIMRRAEELFKTEMVPDPEYAFDHSVDLGKIKINLPEPEKYEFPLWCKSLKKVPLHESKHFDAQVSLEASSIYVAAEVFDCDPRVLDHLYWSEGLLPTFKRNFAQDTSMDFQYFCSANGFLRHYPGASWESMYKLKLDEVADVYDCRLRPWYVSAGGAPRDVLVLLDASGSMDNSSNQYIAEQFTLALLSALTDDDRVNVMRFNVIVESPIDCESFKKLVPANHVNSAAMMAALKLYGMTNETWMADVFKYAVDMLKRERRSKTRPHACQQAIVLLTDSMYENYTMLLRKLDPEGRIRLFTMWLHDPNGLRDDTRAFADHACCDRDGYFAELISHADVTQQVLRVLQVMQRPLVAQRARRLRVFSDVYAHVEDPRRSEHFWKVKEDAEQLHRYRELRKNKERLLNSTGLLDYHLRQVKYDQNGFYYEGETLNYRLQISVSVPVFESTTSENITIKLDEEKQRDATRTYPVNRLLGVAGVDIPIDHLKLILPYHKIGAGGSLFIVDHRGNIVLHDNLKPIFDGDILKPGYRTVDFLDLEQPAEATKPRHYPNEWLKLRQKMIIDVTEGNYTIYGKNIFENGTRANLELREYHWKRVLDHYTAVVVLPKNYEKRHIAHDTAFTKELAEEALKSLTDTDFVVHPGWLYCQHVDPYFSDREAEVRHFLRRRTHEPGFAPRALKHDFSPRPPTLLEKTYQCNTELIASLCHEAIATDQWAREHEDPDTDRDCSTCEMGSTTAFYVGESGLTRWQQYHATSSHAEPPSGALWPLGPEEAWYRRAVASPDTWVIHAPVEPISYMRNSFLQPPEYTERHRWLTAARTLSDARRGAVGVAGYHFYPEHLVDLLRSVTNFPCKEEDPADCDLRCDGETWSCVLVDENGWIVAREGREETEAEGTPLQEHLATIHPAAMAALLTARVFELNWLHDYQGVCFPLKDEKVKSSAVTIVPNILKSVWHLFRVLLFVTQEMATLLTVMSSSMLVSAETEKEKEKRKNRLRRDYEREKFERLFDARVLINRTRIAACDRSRPFYTLNITNVLKKVSEPARPCSWPLVLAQVPATNLLLVAVYNRCSAPAAPVPDPHSNTPYLEDEAGGSRRRSAASRLACWRNRVQLPARPPPTVCYPHNYSAEIGYRQCGPWLPDPEVEDTASGHIPFKTLFVLTIMFAFLI